MMDHDYNAEDRKSQLVEQLPVLLTPKDVMDILGVGKNTVYWLLDSGKLSGFRVGKSWRIPIKNIQEFMS